jgi:hypothetical protein
MLILAADTLSMMSDLVDSNWPRAALYFLAAALSFYAAMLQRRRAASGADRVMWFWFGLAGLLALLGVGRLGDLGPWITDQGREIAEAQGWYDDRRRFQSKAVELVLLMGAGTIGVGLLWFFWSASREHPLAFIAIAFLMTYVAVRAISWHTADAVLYSHPFGGPHPNGPIEIAGTLLMCIAAAWAVLKLSGDAAPT